MKDDPLANAVSHASEGGQCWVALGELLRRSVAEAGGKQALHRRWATQKPGVMLARCEALVGAIDKAWPRQSPLTPLTLARPYASPLTPCSALSLRAHCEEG